MRRGEKEGKRRSRKVKGRGKAEQRMGKKWEKKVRTTAVWNGKRKGGEVGKKWKSRRKKRKGKRKMREEGMRNKGRKS